MNRWQNSLLNLILITPVLIILGLQSATAQDREWPRTISLEQGLVTIYQPQVDEMVENTIRYRAAIAYREDASAEPRIAFHHVKLKMASNVTSHQVTTLLFECLPDRDLLQLVQLTICIRSVRF